jgi:hypothetical protein
MVPSQRGEPSSADCDPSGIPQLLMPARALKTPRGRAKRAGILGQSRFHFEGFTSGLVCKCLAQPKCPSQQFGSARRSRRAPESVTLQSVRPRKRKEISLEMPVWLQPEAIAGSAVRHVASLSADFDRVEWVPKKSARSVLSIGTPVSGASCHWSIDVRAGAGGPKIGILRIFSRSATGFSDSVRLSVAKVADELGEQWLRG